MFTFIIALGWNILLVIAAWEASDESVKGSFRFLSLCVIFGLAFTASYFVFLVNNA